MSPLSRTFWLGSGLIVLTNAVALGGVIYNRSGEPDSRLRVSERELQVPYSSFYDRDSAHAQLLQLNVEIAQGWVTVEKLQTLGFALRADNWQYSGREQERDAVVVLELNGPAYQAELQAARDELSKAQQFLASTADNPRAQNDVDNAEGHLQNLEADASRLYIVDAGLEGAQLRQRYPDRTRYALAHATVRYERRRTGEGENDMTLNLYADLIDFSVPNQARDVFAGWTWRERNADGKSKASVELAFGKRYEPWITAASKR